MNDDARNAVGVAGGATSATYRPPTVTYLGNLADLTQNKTVGAADGSTFNGLDQGSI